MKGIKKLIWIIAILVFLAVIISFVNNKLMNDLFAQDVSNHYFLLAILFFSVLVLILSIIFFDKKSF